MAIRGALVTQSVVCLTMVIRGALVTQSVVCLTMVIRGALVTQSVCPIGSGVDHGNARCLGDTIGMPNR